MSAPALIAIRPEPGLSATLSRGAALGLAVTGWPLFAVRALPWDVPDPRAFDRLLIGSGNAVRHAGAGLRVLARLPVLAVGRETAAAARDAGLTVARTGEGDLQSVVDELTGTSSRLLRLTGRTHRTLRPPPGVRVDTRLVYAAHGLPIPPALANTLAEGAVVLLHSGEAAAHFARECDRLALLRDRIGIAALAPRIADRAGPGWRRVRAAQAPDDAALLALAGRMCKERG